VTWHAVVDAVSVYLVSNIGMLALEGIVGVFALISLGIVFWIKPKFTELNTEALDPTDEPEQATGQM
jgi:hypothetical protein